MIMEIKRGDIILVDLGVGSGSIQNGLRPCCVVSNELNNRHSPNLTVVPLTSKVYKKQMPTHIKIVKEMYPIHTDSIVLCEQIMTIDKARINGSVLFSLNQLEIKKLDVAMGIQLGLVDVRQSSTNRTVRTA